MRLLRLLLAADHHRAVLDIRAEDAADRPAGSGAIVDILRDHVVAVRAAYFPCAFVAFGPALAGVAATAIDGEAGVAARQVGHFGRTGQPAEARGGQGGAARLNGAGRCGPARFHWKLLSDGVKDAATRRVRYQMERRTGQELPVRATFSLRNTQL